MATLELPFPQTDGTPFRLHPGLDPSRYVMPGTLRNVRQWKAFCYVGNDCEEKDHQTMQDVGYVMISLVDNTIIPISRGDEHHCGYDLLHDLACGDYPGPGSKKSKAISINPRDYVPIWSHGTNYVYGTKDLPIMVSALRKWLAWEGCDGIVWGANTMRGRALSSSQFVARDGDVTVSPGHLAPIGAEIHNRFLKLSKTLVDLVPSPDRIQMAPAYNLTADLLAFLEPFGYNVGTNHEWMEAAKKRLRDVRKSGESQQLWEFLFGFHGLKNALHIYLREQSENDNSWGRDSTIAIWGDLGLAIDMLGRL